MKNHTNWSKNFIIFQSEFMKVLLLIYFIDFKYFYFVDCFDENCWYNRLYFWLEVACEKWSTTTWELIFPKNERRDGHDKRERALDAIAYKKMKMRDINQITNNKNEWWVISYLILI